MPGAAGSKIFVSYKYKDCNVQQLDGIAPTEDTSFMFTPRHYVDVLIGLFGSDYIYKGERSGEDASHLSDDTIDSRLKEKLFDSSVTIVLLSPEMWDKTKLVSEQWIPQEVSYSLRSKERNGRISRNNALLLVALPDRNGSYDYAVQHKACGVTEWQTASFFPIIRSNMFNRKQQNQTPCVICYGGHHHGNDHSYAHPVKWHDFLGSHYEYIELAASLRDRVDEFKLKINL